MVVEFGLTKILRGCGIVFTAFIATLFMAGTADAGPDCIFRSQEFNTYKKTDLRFDYPPGWSLTYCSGYTFAFQSDGNFVVYDGQEPLWSTNTANQGATRMVMQDDGNLVIYAGTTPLWNSQTSGKPGAFLRFQADGNAVIYHGAGPAWATPTGYEPKVFHGQKDDKQYCDMIVYPRANGKHVAATLFSNGKSVDGDHYLAWLTVPTRSGGKGLLVQHSAGVKGAFACKGSCERATSSEGEGRVDPDELDWGRAQFVCTANFDELPDEQIAEFAVKIISLLLL